MGSVTLGGNEALWGSLWRPLEQARSGLSTYLDLATAHPIFVMVERLGVRWRVLGPPNPTPHEARDELAHQFLIPAAQAAPGSPRAERLR
jgi:hypothetical protein